MLSLSIPASHPLRKVSGDDFKGLVKALWDWSLCDLCQQFEPARQICSPPTCPGMRWGKLKQFFSYYQAVTGSYVPDLNAGIPPALSSHGDLFAIIRFLRDNPDMERTQLAADYFRSRYPGKLPQEADQSRALRIALSVMTMTACGSENSSLDALESGISSIHWRGDMSWAQFIKASLPATMDSTDPSHFLTEATTAQGLKQLVTARNLIKEAKLHFIPTTDLSSHLKLDRQAGTVQMYHHTAFLKESLVASRENPRGHIPRRLAIEVLNSIQETLFPSSADARLLLRSLVNKNNLDPDCLTFEPSSYHVDGEEVVSYRFLEPRLVELYEELVNPTARGFMEKWLERKSGGRYVMMATLAGVAIAVVLGILSLAVSIFQAWIGWQQWRHPLGT